MDSLTPRLLVCDDDPGVIESYKIVLSSVTKGSSPKDFFGLQKAENELFGDLVLDDYPVDWRIDYVEDGESAVAKVKLALANADLYNAVFLDVRMPPGIDGFEAASHIRKMDPEVHIVVVTGYSDYTFEDFLEVAGPEQRLTYLKKPVWPDELRSVVSSLLNNPAIPTGDRSALPAAKDGAEEG